MKRFLFILLIVLLALAVIGVTVYFVTFWNQKPGQEDITPPDSKGLVLKVNEDLIYPDSQDIALPLNQNCELQVISGKKLTASIKVHTDSIHAFDYHIKEEVFRFFNGMDITAAFSIDVQERSIKLSTNVIAVKKLFSTLHDVTSEEVEVDQLDESYTYCYLHVRSDSEEIIIALPGILTNKIPVSGIDVDNKEIVF